MQNMYSLWQAMELDAEVVTRCEDKGEADLARH